MKVSPLPDIDVRLCVGIDELRKLSEKLGVSDVDVKNLHGCAIHIEITASGAYLGVVYISEHNTETHSVINTLSHEATHVVQNYFKWLGERKPGKEAWAYAIGNVTEALFKKWEKKNGNKKKSKD